MSTISPLEPEPPSSTSSPPEIPTAFRKAAQPKTCFPFTWRAMSFRRRSGGATALRRNVIWMNFVFRFAMSVFNIMRFSFGNNLASIIVGIILGFGNLYFVTLCLAFLGRAEGTRRVGGVKWNRVCFDVVLWLSAMAHAVIIAFCFLGLRPVIVGVVWIVLGVLLLFFGWIAARPVNVDALHADV